MRGPVQEMLVAGERLPEETVIAGLAATAGVAGVAATAGIAGLAATAGVAGVAATAGVAGFAGVAGACAKAPAAKRPEIKVARILFIWRFPEITLLEKVPRNFRRPTCNEVCL